ncbi:hypothetical protein BHE74_00031627 [Ensete ventricosum]|nr:hypothetical protein GW17_00037053 [Ensete ventricosum]RWW61315.1 hypothetical protein BHE74_00031627 [Ensete ventricosum]RZS03120.1 hypothetical protein BHM03_00033259 [Ensete ventricosum]
MTVTWLYPPLRATAIALCEPSRTLPCAQGPRVRILRAIITVPPPSLGEGLVGQRGGEVVAEAVQGHYRVAVAMGLTEIG